MMLFMLVLFTLLFAGVLFLWAILRYAQADIDADYEDEDF